MVWLTDFGSARDRNGNPFLPCILAKKIAVDSPARRDAQKDFSYQSSVRKEEAGRPSVLNKLPFA